MDGWHTSLENSKWFVENVKPGVRKATHFIAGDGSVFTIVRVIDTRGRERLMIIKHSVTGYILKVVTIDAADVDVLIKAIRSVMT